MNVWHSHRISYVSESRESKLTTAAKRWDDVMGTTPDRLTALTLIAAGAVAGAVLRHVVTLAVPAPFPWGTLAVNVAGACLLGALLVGTTDADAALRLLAGTGFCSSFTTYSAFAVETQGLAPELAVLNVVANYALGIGAVALGHALVRWQA